MADREVKVRITTDPSQAIQGLNQFKSHLTDFERKSVSLVTQIKTHWLALSAAVAGVGLTLTKAWNMAQVAAEYEEQRDILDNLARTYQQTADSIVASMRRASSNMISDAELTKTALSGLSRGLNPDQMIALADAAKILSDTVGKTASETLQNLTEALETGRARGLKPYAGATLDLKDAFGELESKMTATEKSQAMYNMMILYADEMKGKQIRSVSETADAMERLDAKYKNLTLAVSRYVKTILVGIADVLHQAETSSKVLYLLSMFTGTYASVRANEAKWRQEAIENAKLRGPVRVFGEETGDLTAAQLAELDMTLLKRTLAARKSASKSAGEKQLKVTTEFDYDNLRRGLEEYKRIIYDAESDMMSSRELAIARIMEEERRAMDKVELLMDEGVISFDEANAAWIKIHQATVYKLTEYNGTFIDSWKRGLREWNDALMTDFQRGADLARTTAEAMSRSFSDLFFDVLSGKCDNFYEYFSRFMDAILRKVSDNLGEMVTQWILGMDAMKQASGGSGLFDAVMSGAGDLFYSGIEAIFGSMVPVMHTGGIVGADATGMRAVPAAVFNSAPRYHRGLAPSEFPAILQRGEGVFTPAQMKALKADSGGQTNITIVALDSRSFEDYARRNSHIFQSVVTQGLRDNKTRTEWKALLR